MLINIAGGRGPMGTTHKPIFENAGHSVIISGRYTTPSLEEAAEKSDVTIISVPIPSTEEIIKRVAPHCHGALMDFTGLKTFPIETMLEYTNSDCEVGGMHPLYRTFKKGASIAYCETGKTNGKCKQVLKSLEDAGARLFRMTPEDHDKLMARTQIARAQQFLILGSLAKLSGIDFQTFYELSPPPTQICLTLLARQLDESNDHMYLAMREYNPYVEEVLVDMQKFSNKLIDPKGLRDFLRGSLNTLQEKADKLVEYHRTNQ